MESNSNLQTLLEKVTLRLQESSRMTFGFSEGEADYTNGYDAGLQNLKDDLEEATSLAEFQADLQNRVKTLLEDTYTPWNSLYYQGTLSAYESVLGLVEEVKV